MATNVTKIGEERFKHSSKYCGKTAQLFALTNTKGNSVQIWNFGACVKSWTVKTGSGETVDVLLGYDSLEGYERDTFYMGQIVGRVANRIANGSYSIEGRHYAMARNNGPHCNHSADRNYGMRLWDAGAVSSPAGGEALALRLRDAPDAALDYPGACDVSALYSYSERDELTIEMGASCDATTPVNMTSHMYFNLDGHDGGTVAGHRVQINATRSLPTDGDDLVTGEITPVSGTGHDLRVMKSLRDAFGPAPDCDRTYCVDGWSAEEPGVLRQAATVAGPKHNLTLTVRTDRPGLHLYTSKYLAVAGSVGKRGAAYGRNAGLCLESQGYPNAVNVAHFPTVLVAPGRPYAHTVVYKLAAL